MSIQIGDILGDYQVTGVLGRGGMGKVFRVRSLLTGRDEAMKIVLPDLDEDPTLADRFLREIQVHASLQHPNIAALYTALRIDDRLVMILELVEGVSLEEMLRRGRVEVAMAVHYITQVLTALAFAHERGVIHRDIKPANILIAADGAVKLTDFGIAKSIGLQRLTGTGLAVGTIAYMSPEQIRSGHADARSDIYSVGLMSYETVTGRRPIQGDTEHALMTAQLSVIPPHPALVNPLVPPAISAAIMRALAKDPAERFQTALDFQAALQSQASVTTTAIATIATATTAPELAGLEARLSRAIGPIAKRLVADAARRYGTLSEIRQALASHIEDPKEREAFFKTSSSVAEATGSRAPASAIQFDPAALELCAQALAPYIGPIAKIVVARAARAARNAQELQSLLAEEIPAAADRQRFLATVRSIL
ncbi:MAG: serine/threonine-protein kinase [Bryobacteraceae bacterium]|jgi:serine/threonine protein kinase